jgi:hypothetical protein
VALPKHGKTTIDDERYLTFEYRRRISDPLGTEDILLRVLVTAP